MKKTKKSKTKLKKLKNKEVNVLDKYLLNDSVYSISKPFIYVTRRVWDSEDAAYYNVRVKQKLGHGGINHLCRNLARNSSLVKLNLTEQNLNSLAANRLAVTLYDHSQIEILILRYNQITNLNSKYWIKLTRKLKRLDLAINGIGTQGATVLAKCLADKHCQLEYLNLFRNQLKDREIKIIADGLAANTSLTELDISYNNFSMEGANYLVKAVESKFTPIKLHMAGTSLNPFKQIKIIQSLKQAQHSNPYLEVASKAAELYLNPSLPSYLKYLPPEIIHHTLLFAGQTLLPKLPIKHIQNKTKKTFKETSNPELFLNKFPEHTIRKPKVISKKKLLSKSTPISGRFNYAVTIKYKLIIAEEFDAPGGSHIDIVKGKPVRSAGVVRFRNGKIKYIDNAAGHYLPYGKNAKKTAINAFANLGFKVKGKYITKAWVNIPELEKGGKWMLQSKMK